jgi:hypothetical protein
MVGLELLVRCTIRPSYDSGGRDVLPFIALILVLLLKPASLLGKAGIEKV